MNGLVFLMKYNILYYMCLLPKQPRYKSKKKHLYNTQCFIHTHYNQITNTNTTRRNPKPDQNAP